MYRSLELDKIRATAAALARRVAERFPGSGLSAIARELEQVIAETGERCRWLAEPVRGLRVFVGLLIVLLVASLVATVAALKISGSTPTLPELIQASEAAINDLVLIGLAIALLVSVEGRLKRRKAQKGLAELRALAHVIDMHQLTKDPERLDRRDADTASSPRHTLTAFQLVRYLDYCSEMLSLTAKVAAVYGQQLRDPVVLTGVNDVEELTSHLSQKIWQKIGMVEAFRRPKAGT